jgi:hypothetical protein
MSSRRTRQAVTGEPESEVSQIHTCRNLPAATETVLLPAEHDLIDNVHCIKTVNSAASQGQPVQQQTLAEQVQQHL